MKTLAPFLPVEIESQLNLKTLKFALRMGRACHGTMSNFFNIEENVLIINQKLKDVDYNKLIIDPNLDPTDI